MQVTLHYPPPETSVQQATRQLRAHWLDGEPLSDWITESCPVREALDLVAGNVVVHRQGWHLWSADPELRPRPPGAPYPTDLFNQYRRWTSRGWYTTDEPYQIACGCTVVEHWLPVPQRPLDEETVVCHTLQFRGLERAAILTRPLETLPFDTYWALLLDELVLRSHSEPDIYFTLEELVQLERQVRARPRVEYDQPTHFPFYDIESWVFVQDLAGWRARLVDFLGLDLEGLDWTQLAVVGSGVIWCTAGPPPSALTDSYAESDLDLVCWTPDVDQYYARVREVYRYVLLQCPEATLVGQMRVYAEHTGHPLDTEPWKRQVMEAVPEATEIQVDLRPPTVTRTNSYEMLWRICGPRHPIEIHRHDRSARSVVPYYHVAPVRAYYDGQQVYYTYSAALAYCTGNMVDVRVSRALEHRKHVVDKTRDRGFRPAWSEDPNLPIARSLFYRGRYDRSWGVAPPVVFGPCREPRDQRGQLLLPALHRALAEGRYADCVTLCEGLNTSYLVALLLTAVDDDGQPLEYRTAELLDHLPLPVIHRHREVWPALLRGDPGPIWESHDTVLRRLVRCYEEPILVRDVLIPPSCWYPAHSLLDQPSDLSVYVWMIRYLLAYPRLLHREMAQYGLLRSPTHLAFLYSWLRDSHPEVRALLEEATVGGRTQIRSGYLIIRRRRLQRHPEDDAWAVTVHDQQCRLGLETVHRYQVDGHRWLVLHKPTLTQVPPLSTLGARAKSARSARVVEMDD